MAFEQRALLGLFPGHSADPRLRADPVRVRDRSLHARKQRYPMMDRHELVSVVDDDQSVRESLPDLLKELGFEVRAASSAEEFLESDYLEKTRCLILDVAMPGMSGPELQQELSRRGLRIPIIFITANPNQIDRPRLLERGAVECLYKPFSEEALLAALDAALRRTRR